jgi:hypothetical protein
MHFLLAHRLPDSQHQNLIIGEAYDQFKTCILQLIHKQQLNSHTI